MVEGGVEMGKPGANWLWFGVIMALINILFTGCGGGTVDPPPAESIAKFRSFSGNSVTLGDLQGYNVYLLIYGSNKDEGDSYNAGSFQSIDSIMTYTQDAISPQSIRTFSTYNPINPLTFPDPQTSFEAKLRVIESELLKLRPSPVKSGVSAAATPPAIGEIRSFYIAYNSNFDKQNRSFICRLKTANAYFWVDSADSINDTVMNSYATAFTNIYATDQNTFGNHWDSDGEPVYILISSILDFCGGYFWAGDKL